MSIETTSSAPDQRAASTPPAGRSDTIDLSSAESALAAAKAAQEATRSQVKRATRALRYHRLRLWAAQKGMAAWVAWLIAGSGAALIVCLFLIVGFGMELPALIVGLLFAYGGVGGAAAWLFRAAPGEDEGNWLERRTDQVRDAEETLRGTEASLANKQAATSEALRRWRAAQEIANSDAYKRQQEANRLLAIDPGRLYPDEFERYVAEIFAHLGYAVQVMGQSGDQGVDVVACKGPARVAIQAKRYIGSVGNSAVQEVYAGMAHLRCHRCMVVTSGAFTSGAVALAQSTGCLLIGAAELPALIRGEIRI